MQPPQEKRDIPPRISTAVEPTHLPSIPDHELLRRVGRGAYGEVWLARSVTGAYRAVKIVFRNSFDHDRPFEREFSGILKFEPISRQHQSQVDILHVGRGEGYFYYVMELADDQATGQQINPVSYVPKTIKSELLQRGKLPFEECLNIGLALITALEHLHSHGLVHRDIKPSNIIFIHGVPKLADIGLVTSVDATRSFVGTEGFAPPEGPGTPQGDLYSLGKVLYEICTGKDRQDFPELPTTLAELPDCDGLVEMNAVIAKACCEAPVHRYQTAAQMHADLLLLQEGKSVARLRTLESTLAKLKRASLVGLLITIVTTVAFFYQSHQTARMKRLATENLTLAQKNQQSAKESRERLRQLQITHGSRFMEEGDYYSSLLWFSQALKLTESNPHSEEVQRYRLGTLLEYSPKLIALYVNEGSASDARFSADEKHIVSLSRTDPSGSVRGRMIKVWDATTGEVVFSTADTNASNAFLSQDGQWAALASAHWLEVWDTVAGKQVGPPLHHSNILFAAFSPDGSKVVTGGADRDARIWEVTTGRLMAPILWHSNTVRFIAFNGYGTRIVTGSGDVEGSHRFGVARVWDATTGSPVTGWLKQDEPISYAEFSPDGHRVVTAGTSVMTNAKHPGTATVWELSAEGRMLFSMAGHGDIIWRATLSPDGTCIATAGTSDCTARIWNARTGESLLPPLKHGGAVLKVVFSPDGRRLATGSETTVQLWDTLTGNLMSPPLHHNGQVSHISFNANGTKLLTASNDRLVRVWDITTCEPTLPSFINSDLISGVAFSPDGNRIVTTDLMGSFQIWNAKTGQPITPFVAFERPTTNTKYIADLDLRATFNSDGTLLVIPQPGAASARVVNAYSGKPVTPPLCHSNSVVSAAFSPDGRCIVTASADQTARVWDAITSLPLTPPLRHNNDVTHASFSPDGRRVVTASEDHTARIWDANTGVPVTPPLPHESVVYDATFSPDGKLVATASFDHTVMIWDASTGQKMVQPMWHKNTVAFVSFSPNGRYILSGSLDGTVCIWDVANGNLIIPPLKHQDFVHMASFSPDGKRVVTASADGTARIWDALTSEALSPAFKHPARVLSVCFSPDGQRILTGGAHQSAQVWETPRMDWPVGDIARLAHLFASGTIDRMSKVAASSPETLEKVWRSLRSRYTDFFGITHRKVVLWHRRQWAQSKFHWQWSAALFHLDHLMKLTPDDQSLPAERVRILARQTPFRDPAARRELIDLSDYYSSSLLVNWHGDDDDDNNLADLPRGLQKFLDIDFDIRGLVQVQKKDEIHPWLKQHPTRISGIRIGQKLHRMHFLHGAIFGEAKAEGTKIGSYMIHFANGLQKEISIIYGRDVRDWWCLDGEPLTTTASQIAWKGSNEDSRKLGKFLRLFKSTWENEFPEVEIAALDFVAHQTHPAPFLIAITIE